MYRRYYSYNDMPVPVNSVNRQQPIKHDERKEDKKEEIKKYNTKAQVKKNHLSFLENLKSDDLVLLAVIFLLLIDDCDDIFLLIALAFIFISGQ